MNTKHLGQDEFFDRLVQLLGQSKCTDEGLAVYLTQKRFSFSRVNSNNYHEDEAALSPLIIRATNCEGKRQEHLKVKLSTVVEPKDVDEFYTRYAEVCKTGMVALKPRDRSRKKAKAKKKKMVY